MILSRLSVVLAFSLVAMTTFASAQTKPSAAEQLKAATQKATAEKYLLAYKFKAGETFRTQVTHLVSVDTKVKGASQTAKTRSISTKSWQIQKVEPNGQITFVHSVDWVDMWSSVTDRPEIKFDSRVDKTAPPGYEHVATSVGVPLATVTIDAAGRILDRVDARPQFNPGIGELTVPFPLEAIKVGDKWHMPEEIKVRDEEGRAKTVQVRQQYLLEKVETGVATIAVSTQIITPIDDPKLEAQVVQRKQKGHVKFDIDAGRILSRQMDLDEQVLSFSGPDSSMQYLARYTEEQAKAEEVASKSAPAKK